MKLLKQSAAKLAISLDNYFAISARGSRVGTEVIAGCTTFLTMAYIIFVNPQILGQAGMPAAAVFTVTCLVAMIGCTLMALIANYPIALAPSMGMNVYFTYSVVMKTGFHWQTALGGVLISGIVFFLLTVFKIRQWIIQSIPPCISIATAAGVGLFIGVIALHNSYID